MASLLLIDDDPALVPKQIRHAFPSPAHTVQVARDGAEGLKRIRSDSPNVVLLDLHLPDQSGMEIYRQIRQIDARIPVIFVTVAKSADAAIEAMREGAFDYLFKPLDLSQLQRVIGEALEVARRLQSLAAIVELPAGGDAQETIIGACPAMREVYKAIGRVAGQNVPVMITGESGTGKELVALAIYKHGPRAERPFRVLNCAAIPEQLLESELFGHEKGSFTGADRRRIGKFEQCNGGTIFLDEIGEMPLALQAKILRLLQDQTFERVGGNETVRTDARLIAATNRDLKARSAHGKFRPDLYYRLSVFSINLPPLREREGDLLILIDQFIQRFGCELGRDVREIAPETMQRLNSYAWPGNVRELQSVLKQAVLNSVGPVLLPTSLPAELQAEGEIGTSGRTPPHFQIGTTLADLERDAIQQCLLETGGNRQRTADLLGISARTLLRKIRSYHLTDPLRSPDSEPADHSELN